MNLTYDFQTLKTTKQTRGKGEGKAQLTEEGPNQGRKSLLLQLYIHWKTNTHRPKRGQKRKTFYHYPR
jgi:hypothetical protein